jgi:hypothetical protein
LLLLHESCWKTRIGVSGIGEHEKLDCSSYLRAAGNSLRCLWYRGALKLDAPLTCELLETRLGVSGVVEQDEKLDIEEQLPFLYKHVGITKR